MLVLFDKRLHRFLSAVAALRAPADAALGSPELALGTARVAGMLDALAVCCDHEDREPDIDAGLASRARPRLGGYLGTRATRVPAVRLPAAGHRLGRALQRAMQANGNAPDLGQAQDAAVQHSTTVLAHLWIREAVIAISALEAGIAGLLSCLHAAEEGGKGLVQTVHDSWPERIV